MKKTLFYALAFAGCCGATTSADLVITESYGGVSGDDGTPDWFELTNLGSTDVSTAGLYYDDESADSDDMVALTEMTIAAGESVIFLIENPSSMTAGAFNEFWGVSGVRVGYADGSGLKEGDTAWLYNENISDWFTSLEIVDVDDAYETTQFGSTLSSVLTGQFYSSGSAEVGPLLGDPGSFTIPAPGAFALMALGGLISRRRQR